MTDWKRVLASVDPYLHTIRAISRSIRREDEELGSLVETSRYNLYLAIEAGEHESVQRWLKSLEVVSGIMKEERHLRSGALAYAVQGIKKEVPSEQESAV